MENTKLFLVQLKRQQNKCDWKEWTVVTLMKILCCVAPCSSPCIVEGSGAVTPREDRTYQAIESGRGEKKTTTTILTSITITATSTTTTNTITITTTTTTTTKREKDTTKMFPVRKTHLSPLPSCQYKMFPSFSFTFTLPSFLPSFLPSYFASSLPSFLPSILLCFIPRPLHRFTPALRDCVNLWKFNDYCRAMQRAFTVSFKGITITVWSEAIFQWGLSSHKYFLLSIALNDAWMCMLMKNNIMKDTNEMIVIGLLLFKTSNYISLLVHVFLEGLCAVINIWVSHYVFLDDSHRKRIYMVHLSKYISQLYGEENECNAFPLSYIKLLLILQ